jgi:hypothetical protein
VKSWTALMTMSMSFMEEDAVLIAGFDLQRP